MVEGWGMFMNTFQEKGGGRGTSRGSKHVIHLAHKKHSPGRTLQ